MGRYKEVATKVSKSSKPKKVKTRSLKPLRKNTKLSKRKKKITMIEQENIFFQNFRQLHNDDKRNSAEVDSSVLLLGTNSNVFLLIDML